MEHAKLPHWEAADNAEKLAKLKTMILELYRYNFADQLRAITQMLQNHLATLADKNEKEATDVNLILEMCQQHPNILSASCEVGHITGSALVVAANTRQVLLNYHPKFNRWLQFGGHPEYETNPWQTALRETQEETGLPDLYFYPEQTPPPLFDVDAHMIAERKGQPAHYHFDFRYLLLTNTPEAARPSHESEEIRWFSLSEALALPNLEYSLERLIRKAQKGLEA